MSWNFNFTDDRLDKAPRWRQLLRRLDSRLRWLVIQLVDATSHPEFGRDEPCWADMALWAMDEREGWIDFWRGTGEHTTADAATCRKESCGPKCGSCYCGKFQAPISQFGKPD